MEEKKMKQKCKVANCNKDSELNTNLFNEHMTRIMKNLELMEKLHIVEEKLCIENVSFTERKNFDKIKENYKQFNSKILSF